MSTIEWLLLMSLKETEEERRRESREAAERDKKMFGGAYVDIYAGDPFREEWVWEEAERPPSVPHWVNVIEQTEGHFILSVDKEELDDSIDSVECESYEEAVGTMEIASASYEVLGTVETRKSRPARKYHIRRAL